MRKIQILTAAFFAAMAFSAVATSTSFAAHEWSTLAGAKVTAPTSSLVDGLLILHWKFFALKILIHCNGQFHGTVSSLGKDEVTEVLGTNGEKGTIDCEVTESNVTGCNVGSLALVTALDLPWATQLELVGTENVDHLLENGKGKPGFEIKCGTETIKCTENENAKFTKNGVEGAEFEFTGTTKAACNVGEGTLLGSEKVLSFLVS
jgi:hypothetical protein